MLRHLFTGMPSTGMKKAVFVPSAFTPCVYTRRFSSLENNYVHMRRYFALLISCRYSMFLLVLLSMIFFTFACSFPLDCCCMRLSWQQSVDSAARRVVSDTYVSWVQNQHPVKRGAMCIWSLPCVVAPSAQPSEVLSTYNPPLLVMPAPPPLEVPLFSPSKRTHKLPVPPSVVHQYPLLWPAIISLSDIWVLRVFLFQTYRKMPLVLCLKGHQWFPLPYVPLYPQMIQTVTCSRPRCHLNSHYLICIKNRLFFVGIVLILNKKLEFIFRSDCSERTCVYS